MCFKFLVLFVDKSLILIFLNLKALAITETELKLIAKAAIIGDNNKPKNGYNTPAAIGTPKVL
jgi:hypothetical protein